MVIDSFLMMASIKLLESILIVAVLEPVAFVKLFSMKYSIMGSKTVWFSSVRALWDTSKIVRLPDDELLLGSVKLPEE